MMTASSREEILMTDLVSRVVEGDLSALTMRDRWRIVDYELEQVGPGRALTNGDWNAGPLRLRLDVAGHYRVSLISRYSTIRLKLSGDRCWSECELVVEGHRFLGKDNIYREGYYDVEEVCWRDADLTGQDLLIDERVPITLMAIRLTPTEPKTDTRETRWPMMFTNDGGCLGARLHRSPDEVFEWCERVPRDSCVRVMVIGSIAGDNCAYPTEVGTELGTFSGRGEGWGGHYTTMVENLRQYRDWGIHPAEAIINHAHERGWEAHYYIRMRGFCDAAPIVGPRSSRFHTEHPEFRLLGPGGEPVQGLSFAYPEVQEHMCRLFAELAGYGADGVTPCFVRGSPPVLYEPIMVDGFKAEHGADPRQLPESDPRWLDYCSAVFTGFMRRAKETLGPECRLSPMIHGTRVLNRQNALDVATWVEEGIVDDLFIMGHRYDRQGGHYGGGPEHLEFEYFQDLPGRDGVRLWPMFYGYGTSGIYEYDWETYWQAMQNWLDQGADGYGFWDIAAMSSDTRANLWDLGKLPRPGYEKPQRLMHKYEMKLWDGYLWNRYTPIDAW